MNDACAYRDSDAAAARRRRQADRRPKVVARDVDVFYGEKQALKSVSLDIPERAVTALIGPSGCGKSTFLRCINRMNDTIEGCRVTGSITLDGNDIYDPVARRGRAARPRRHGLPEAEPVSRSRSSRTSPTARASTALSRSKAELEEIVISSLKRASL